MRKSILILIVLLRVTPVFGDLLGNDTPAQLTTAQKQIRNARMIKSTSKQTVLSDIEAFNQIYHLVWNNPDGLTPQEVCNGLDAQYGTPTCLQMFQAASMRAQEINAFLPGTLPEQAPKSITVNQDGTVTIGD